jgi:hypothetical protein
MNWKGVVKGPKVTLDYIERYKMAEMTFKHQRVYDLATKSLVPLNPFPTSFILTSEISHNIGEYCDIELGI